MSGRRRKEEMDGGRVDEGREEGGETDGNNIPTQKCGNASS